MIPITYIKSKEEDFNQQNTLLPNIRKCFYFNVKNIISREFGAGLIPRKYTNNGGLIKLTLYKKIIILENENIERLEYEEWAKYCDPDGIYEKLCY